MPETQPQSTPAPRWYAAYIAMAVFTALVQLGGLFFSHTTVGRFAASVEASSTRESIFVSLDRLRSLGSAADIPGNNIFRSLDTQKEAAALASAVESYQRQSSSFREQLLALQPTPSTQTLEHLYKMDDAVFGMAITTKEILSLFEAGQTERAASKMAELDEQSAQLGQHCTDLQETLRGIAHTELERAHSVVISSQTYERLLASMILVALGFAVLHGFNLSQQFKMGTLIRRRISRLENHKSSGPPVGYGPIAHKIMGC